MKNNKSTKIFYIILVPVILVVILLNSGFLQARVPAVTVSGASYNVAQFNYYYFAAYNDFVDENFDESGYNGPFDQSVDLRSQQKDEDTTWKEYFIQQAEEKLVEVTYFYSQATVAGYEFSEEELAPVEENLALINEEASDSGITLKNYLVAYWGVGMTEDIYTQELTRRVKAEAYEAYLTTIGEVEQTALDQWIQENQPESYPSANLTVICLKAAEDRFTGEVGETQLSDLSAKLERLAARYESDPSQLTALAEEFNDDDTLAKNQGALLNQTRDSLPAPVAEWVFDETTQLGDWTAVMDEENACAYLVRLDSWGEDAAEQDALRAVRQQQVADKLESVRENASISYRKLGSRLIGR
jgi:hypothetical protein